MDNSKQRDYRDRSDLRNQVIVNGFPAVFNDSAARPPRSVILPPPTIKSARQTAERAGSQAANLAVNNGVPFPPALAPLPAAHQPQGLRYDQLGGQNYMQPFGSIGNEIEMQHRSPQGSWQQQQQQHQINGYQNQRSPVPASHLSHQSSQIYFGSPSPVHQGSSGGYEQQPSQFPVQPQGIPLPPQQPLAFPQPPQVGFQNGEPLLSSSQEQNTWQRQGGSPSQAMPPLAQNGGYAYGEQLSSGKNQNCQGNGSVDEYRGWYYLPDGTQVYGVLPPYGS